MVPMWMFAPAIACGNTFVLKPSEKDPSASVYLAAAAAGGRRCRTACSTSCTATRSRSTRCSSTPTSRAISFVGSTPIAQLHLRDRRRRTAKRCQALGGAKNHMVVLPDADIDMAADAAVSRRLRLGRRALHGDLDGRRRRRRGGRRSSRAIKERIPKIKVGDGLEPGVEMGPLITREHRDKVASYIENGAREQGAKVVVDGRETTPDGDGFFLGVVAARRRRRRRWTPTRTRSSARCSASRASTTYDEALRLVNENPYGNGTAIFTRDGGVARQFQFDVQAGMVGVNVPIPVPVAYYSFGGWKASLFGDRTSTGRRGSTSTRAARSSRRAGPTRRRARSTSASRRRADAFAESAAHFPRRSSRRASRDVAPAGEARLRRRPRVGRARLVPQGSAPEKPSTLQGRTESRGLSVSKASLLSLAQPPRLRARPG